MLEGNRTNQALESVVTQDRQSLFSIAFVFARTFGAAVFECVYEDFFVVLIVWENKLQVFQDPLHKDPDIAEHGASMCGL